jgi:hypothetical protein
MHAHLEHFEFIVGKVHLLADKSMDVSNKWDLTFFVWVPHLICCTNVFFSMLV